MSARRPALLPATLLCASAALHAGSASAADDCAAANGFTPLCGFQHPEDIEVLADGKLLVVSEYGNLVGSMTGRLTAVVPADGSRRTLYPVDGADGTADWGAADCPGAPGAQFDPHGIHHGPTSNGRLYVVNHAGRESVEIFEVVDGDDAAAMKLNWRGCVIAPGGIWMNDVVGLPDGGFIASHMVQKGVSAESLYESERRREDIGHVMRWSPGDGWRKVANSDGALPNGVEISDDAATLYVNEYFGDRTFALDLASGKRLWTTPVDAPDNLAWGSDGQLLIASHHEDLKAVQACEHEQPYCQLRFSIVAVDPANGNRLTVVEGGGAPPFGAATVAAEVGDTMYLGSYTGDRMATTTRGTGVRD
ncbi:MAG: SMP-30/gluconolactonase/LRE family protein [Gammaproteobacteria bacterium]|nr:SMP-30/gluconolactonase/LRE family protein [Gammaproteobacteria bacterium]